MAELWTDKINRNTDWGGDASTNHLPVAGSAVQEFIKGELNNKIGVIYHDGLNSRYLCFSNEEDKNAYLEDTSLTDLIMYEMAAPSSYSAKIHVNNHYKAVLINAKDENLVFDYEITYNGEEFIDNIRYEVTINKNGVKSKINGEGIYGKPTSIKLDEFLTKSGSLSISIVIVGKTTEATAAATITYDVVDLIFTEPKDKDGQNANKKIISTVYDEENPLIVNYSIFSTSNTKYIEWYIDGNHLETDIIQRGIAEPIVDNKRIAVTNMSYGIHNVQFRAYVSMNGENFYTDIFYKEFIVNTKEDNKYPVIAIETVIPKSIGIKNNGEIYNVVQHEMYNINYGVYNPEKLAYIPVEIYFDNKPLKTVNAPNNEELLCSIIPNNYGNKILCFKINDYIKNITLHVSPTSMDLQENTNNLLLSLSASGRTNEDENRDKWIFGDYITTFEGFNWNNLSGWNDNRLVISKDMSITNTICPLLDTKNGKTLEFEFETFNVTDDDAIICDLRNNDNIGLCITASKAFLNVGAEESVSTNYKSEENVRISFVIDSLNKLALIYVNGIVSGAVTFNSNFNINKQLCFKGSNSAGIKLKQIKIYDTQLSSEQILNNYILYRNTISEIKELYNRNDILDGGIISPEKVSNFIPVILLTGEQIFELETQKDTDLEIKIDVEYINKQDPTHQFKFYGGCCRIQGTSSAGYVRKNWRIYSKRKDKFVADVYDWQGKLVTDSKRRIAFKKDAVPVNCWTLKADFAESSGTHNTGVATLWNEVMYNAIKAGEVNKGYICRTAAQIAAKDNNYEFDCRTTVDGFPVVVFARRNEQEKTYTFMGKYNFNNDKSTENVFGFCDIPGFDVDENGDSINVYIPGHENKIIPEGEFNEGKPYTYKNKVQCWEIKDSEDKYALFKTVDGWYDIQKDENGNNRIDGDKIPIKNWATGFEARYPDDGNEADTSDLITFAEWLISCDKEKFYNEKKSHLDIWKIAAYYVYLYRFGAVDQVVKNAMLATEDGHHWYFINYDNDTILGLNNSGILTYPPTINRDTRSGATYAYAGRESKLWNLLEDDEEFMTYYVPEADNALYQGGLTYENTLKYFNTNQCDKWSETIYNEDAKYKYIQPYTSGRVNELAKLQGSRKSHRTWWLSKRFQLMDAKFNNFNSTSKYIHMKLEGSKFAEFTIKSSDPMYFSSVINKAAWYTGVFLDEGESKTFSIDRSFNLGSPIYIYSPLYIEELDLSSMSEYIYLLEFGTLVDPIMSARMKKLIIGKNKTAKPMEAISGLNALTNLEYLDLTGVDCGNIDISNLFMLKTLILTDSTIDTLTLPKGCTIERLELNKKLNELECFDLHNLTWNNIYGFEDHHISSLSIKNCPQLTNNFNPIREWIKKVNPGDSIILEGIKWENVNPESLLDFQILKDNDVTFQLKGEISITDITLEQVYKLQDLFGENCFKYNGEFWISAPDSIFILGDEEIRSDTSYEYTARIISKNQGTVDWSIISGWEYVKELNIKSDNVVELVPNEIFTDSEKITLKAVYTPLNSYSSVITTLDIISHKLNYASSGRIIGNTTLKKMTEEEEIFKFELDLGDDIYLGKYSTEWCLEGTSVNDGSIAIVESTNEYVKIGYKESVTFDTCSLIANVTNANPNNTQFEIRIDITVTDDKVLMTSTSNPKVLRILRANFGNVFEHDNVIYKSEAVKLSDEEFSIWIKNEKGDNKRVFEGTDIESFDEFEFFTGLTNIPNNAFYACRSLKSIKIPKQIQTIGSLAFGYTAIESIEIPALVSSINYNSFIYASNLKEFIVSSGNENYKTIDSILVDNNNIMIKYPEGREENSYTINSNIIGLGPQSIHNTKLEELNTGSVKTHSSESIARNTLLKSITIEKDFEDTNLSTHICNNEKLEEIIVKENPKLLSDNGIVYDKNMSILIKYPENKVWSDILPVELIGSYALWACKNLKEVTIPNSVTGIERYAFYFSSINKLTFAENSSLKHIDSYGFAYVSNLPEIKLPGTLEWLGSNAFTGCVSVNTIHFGGNAPKLRDLVNGERITSVFGADTNLMGYNVPKNDYENEIYHRRCYVPSNATGYDDAWNNSLFSTERNDFAKLSTS